jgi:hypothetical protein
MPSAEDLVKALDLLIHDLRAPLSVAQGYLRLLRDGQLPDGEAQARAFADTGAALGRVARLCETASAIAHESDVPVLVSVPASLLLERLRASCIEAGWETQVMVNGGSAHVRVTQLDNSGHAILCVLRWVRERHPETTVLLTTTAGELRCAVARPGEQGAFDSEPPIVWEPWPRGGGLPLAAAHREISRMGGRVWSTPGAAPGVVVVLPLVTS